MDSGQQVVIILLKYQNLCICVLLSLLFSFLPPPFFSVLVSTFCLNPQALFYFQFFLPSHCRRGSEQTAVWCLAACQAKLQHISYR